MQPHSQYGTVRAMHAVLLVGQNAEPHQFPLFSQHSLGPHDPAACIPRADIVRPRYMGEKGEGEIIRTYPPNEKLSAFFTTTIVVLCLSHCL